MTQTLTIHKYPLRVMLDQVIEMPRHAKILTCQWQWNTAVMWAEVCPELPMQPRRILMFGTGHSMNADNGKYIGTVQDSSGFVWHYYDDGVTS